MDKSVLKHFPRSPGVYQIFDKDHKILYVGKAKNLKKRLSNYFRSNLDPKTEVLMRHARIIEPIITANENEALLLENTLIKKLKPRYNILFKDDKSYPYITISKHKFSRLALHRGAQKESTLYYGPYPNAQAARETLDLLQKMFKIRSCNDLFFNNRSRPCIQYQIKRCSAPCVNYVTPEEYIESVKLTEKFLTGKNRLLLKKIEEKMQEASLKLKYEEAAYYRDQLENLERVFQQQYVENKQGNVDVIAVANREPYLCIQLLFIRNGKVVGTKSYFKKDSNPVELTEVISSFLTQYYLGFPKKAFLPKHILLDRKLPDKTWIQNALKEQLQFSLTIHDATRSTNYAWVKMAKTNALYALSFYLTKQNDFYLAFQNLITIFSLPVFPRTIECFDISHTAGTITMASCVVFTVEGAAKEKYRRFRIENVAKSDDYAAIRQALKKRYATKSFPSLVIIDGGKGQLTSAKKIINNPNVPILAIAKGPSRKPGEEVIYATTLNQPVVLKPDSPILHMLQQIRDEAHRFAITGHRKTREKRSTISILEEIPGVGPKKRQALLTYFSGIQKLKSATIEEIMQVPGINQALAKSIYEALNSKNMVGNS